nr:alpha-galactosidase [Rhodoferax sp.]
MAANFFRLDGLHDTLVLHSEQNRLPRLLYWGSPLPQGTDMDSLAMAAQRPVPHGGLDQEEEVSWLPEPGRGFTDAPGLVMRRGSRGLYTQLHITSARAIAHGWEIECADALAQISVVLNIDMEPTTGVVSARSGLTNQGIDNVQIDWFASITLPVPEYLQHRHSIGGRWSEEFRLTREPIGSAGWLQESRLGRTSHHAFPGLLLSAGDAQASQGEVWAGHLAWSGNHRTLLQRCRMGGMQWQMGELLLPGEVDLAPQETYTTPVAHFARSGTGHRNLSYRWHQFVRSQVLPQPHTPKTRPVQFSTWEATYFDHDARRLRALAEAAAELGVERFVLDDGWFVGRHDDRAGLGDWDPCPARYPQGLGPLAEHCRDLGMEFGLWVEPESVSANSNLYRAHPDWVLGIADLPQPLGRHQYVLNMGLPEVRAYLFESLSRLLRGTPICFLKWDMNRDMTHAVGLNGRAGAHAHVLGLYALLDQLREAYPYLQIETCASGGARADFGILRRTDRVWVSDCNDPLSRQRIQQGFLLFFPPELMGAHVGDARSHTNGRTASIALRTLSALFGHMGIEANLLNMRGEDLDFLRTALHVYKEHRDWIHQGFVAEVEHPDPHLHVVSAIAQDLGKALLSVVVLESTRTSVAAPVRLRGLDREAVYRVRVHPHWLARAAAGKTSSAFHQGTTLALSGSVLAEHGLQIPVLTVGDCILLELLRDV